MFLDIYRSVCMRLSHCVSKCNMAEVAHNTKMFIRAIHLEFSKQRNKENYSPIYKRGICVSIHSKYAIFLIILF